MSTEDLKLQLLTAFADAWNRHDVDALMSMMTDDVVEGRVSESSFRQAVVWLVGSRFAGTLLAQLCSGEPLRAEYYCSFETSADYVPRWQAAGLCVTGLGEQGELRAFSLPSSRFFLATLFQPQLSSRARAPHPIVTGFLRACAGEPLRG